MRNKILCVLLTIMLFSQSVNANVIAPVPKISAEATTEVTTTFTLDAPSASVSGLPFTVGGNLTIDDNLSTKDNKEFYTVHSKNGAEFFIVIDKASASNNVYFLNAVDEQDLFDLIEDYQLSEDISETTTEAPSIETTLSDSEAIPVGSAKSNEGSSLPLIIIVVAVVVIGIYIFKKKMRKDEEDEDEDEVEDEDEDEDDTEVLSEDDKFNDVENDNTGFGADENKFSFVEERKTEFEAVNEANDDEAVDLLDDEEDY